MSLDQTTRYRRIRPLSLLFAAGLGLSQQLPAAFAFDGGQPTGQLVPTSEINVDLERISNAFSDIAERVKPSVVSIRSEAFNEEMNAELRRMLGDDNFQPIPISGTGSGVIIDAAGYIVTNNHVVEGAQRVNVTLSDGREFDARVTGTDVLTDLAVIKIDGGLLTPCRFGDSDAVRVGHLVLAIGSPFKFGHSVSHGMISAVGRRNVDVEIDYKNWLQTDAPINPGNSGGPLINTRGEIIGISVAIATESGGYQGVGFAIPSNTVARVTDSLKRGQKVVRGYLGVVIKGVDRDTAEVYGLTAAKGAMLDTIGPDSPASKAGLRPEDIILSIDGRDVNGQEELQERVAHMSPGTRSVFKVWRQQAPRDLTVEIGRQPDDFRTHGERRSLIPRDRSDVEPMEPTDRMLESVRSSKSEFGSEYFETLGMHVANLTPELKTKYGVDDSDLTGVLITGVDPNGSAFSAGIRRRCVIHRVNDEDVRDLSEFKSAIQKLKDEKGVRFQLQLEDKTFHTAVRFR